MNILSIRNLAVEYYRNKRVIPAVRDVSLDIEKGTTMALVGESGSGKSTLALAAMGLIFPDDGRVVSGSVLFRGRNLLSLSNREWQQVRGKEIAMVFQDPFSSLNPVLTAGEQVIESVAVHRRDLAHAARVSLAEEALREVLFTDPERLMHSYPHQLSGGQRQRIALAAAIVNRPQLLIADEPTTALDVTTQKEVLDLLGKLKEELSLTVILITHNLPLAAERSDAVAVMYAGEIVETGPTGSVFRNPAHPYTRGLLRSVPKLLNK